MNTTQFEAYYFIGIGGIGMSALARYFRALNKPVAGYDRTPTSLTNSLAENEIEVHFEDSIECIPEVFRNKENTLVIYTPAVPDQHKELSFFRANNFTIMKRAEVLGVLTNQSKGLAVAGSHGKTTVSTMLGHILYQSHLPAAAVLGGIATNYNTNILLPEPNNEFTVVEADEFDRSLLQLHPHMAIVTALDADHLDIYGNKEELKKTFKQFVSQIQDNGVLLYKKGIDIDLPPKTNSRLRVLEYAVHEEADFYATNIQKKGVAYQFDLCTPTDTITNICLQVPGLINLENAIAAAGIAWLAGATASEIKEHLKSFSGIKRRFEYIMNTPQCVYVDDYAHHPEELKAIIQSVKAIYPDRKITAAFQPHLYSRTQDFATGFAESLSLLDVVILLDIYPAREEPIPGITSKIIFDKITQTNKMLIRKEELLDTINKNELDVFLTLGAGNIDQYVEPIRQILTK